MTESYRNINKLYEKMNIIHCKILCYLPPIKENEKVPINVKTDYEKALIKSIIMNRLKELKWLDLATVYIPNKKITLKSTDDTHITYSMETYDTDSDDEMDVLLDNAHIF